MARASAQKFFSMSPMLGGINTIAEDGTLVSVFNARANPPQPIEFRDMENMTPLRRGGLQKTKGFTQFCNIGTGTTTGIYRYKNSSGVNKLLATHGTQLYDITSGTASSIYTGLQNNAYTDFETGQDLCIICDGINTPFKYNGSTVAALGGSPPSGARQSVYFKNRLWVFSVTNNRGLLYYSDAGAIEAGYSSNFVQCDVNDGQFITGIVKLFLPGELEPTLIVAKDRSVGIITGDGTLASPFTFAKLNEDSGVPGFRQFVQFGSDVAYYTPKGVTSYKTDVERVNLQFFYLSEKVRDQFTALNYDYMPDAIAWYDWPNRRLSFAVTEVGGFTKPNVIWHYDIEYQSWYKERWADSQPCTCVFVDDTGSIYHGDTGGKVYLHGDYDSFAGQPIEAFFETDYMNFGESSIAKRLIEVQCTARGEGAYPISISSQINYGAQLGTNHSVPLSGALYTWGGGVWTNNSAIYQWGAAPLRNKRFYPGGWFENIKLRFSNVAADEPFDIFDIRMLVEYGEYR